MLFDIILILVLTICFITDIKVQKIYNKVIFPTLLIVMLLQGIINGYEGLILSLTGFLVGLGVLLIPYLLGGIGAGDVKLLALIGAIKGSIFVLNAAIYMAVIGGVIALVLVLLHKETLNFFRCLFRWLILLSYGMKYELNLPTSAFLKKYPYGVAIVGGTLICLISKGVWII